MTNVYLENLQAAVTAESIAWQSLMELVRSELECVNELKSSLEVVQQQAALAEDIVVEVGQLLATNMQQHLETQMPARMNEWIKAFSEDVTGLAQELDDLIQQFDPEIESIEQAGQTLLDDVEVGVESLRSEFSDMLQGAIEDTGHQVESASAAIEEALTNFHEDLTVALTSTTDEIREEVSRAIEALAGDAEGSRDDLETAKAALEQRLGEAFESSIQALTNLRERTEGLADDLHSTYLTFMDAISTSRELMNATGSGMTVGSQSLDAVSGILNSVG